MKEKKEKKPIIFWIVIIIGVFTSLGFLGIFDKKQKDDVQEATTSGYWYSNIDEYDLVSRVKSFLKTKVNYPTTFELLNWPTIKYGSSEERSITLSGQFKCANAFNVYTEHKFVVLVKVEGKKLIVEDYSIV